MIFKNVSKIEKTHLHEIKKNIFHSTCTQKQTKMIMYKGVNGFY